MRVLTNGMALAQMECETMGEKQYNVSLTIDGGGSIGFLPSLSSVEPKFQRVIFNGPATIVFWTDGTKTVVKCHGEKFDPEKGLAMAAMKKRFPDEYRAMIKAAKEGRKDGDLH